jgi:hypothetical protein
MDNNFIDEMQRLQKRVLAIESEYMSSLNNFIDELFNKIKSMYKKRNPFINQIEEDIILNIEESIRNLNNHYNNILCEIKEKEINGRDELNNTVEPLITHVQHTIKRPATFTIQYVLPILTYLKVST